jgi:hypothetical protein
MTKLRWPVGAGGSAVLAVMIFLAGARVWAASGPVAQLVSPAGGEMFVSGQSATVTVAVSSAALSLNINLSTDGGQTYPIVIASNINNSGKNKQPTQSASFTVPTLNSDQCYVQVVAKTSKSSVTVTSGVFSITTSKPTGGGQLSSAAISGTLGVTGATTLSTLATSGPATLNSVNVSTNAALGGLLNVSGATTLGGTLAVTGATTLGSTLAVTGDATIGGNLTVDGTLITPNGFTVSGLNVSGATTFSGAVTDSGSLTVDGVLYANGGINTTSGNLALGAATNKTFVTGALNAGATTVTNLSAGGLSLTNGANATVFTIPAVDETLDLPESSGRLALTTDITANNLTGAVAVANGGTGLSSLPANTILSVSSANTVATASVSSFGLQFIDLSDPTAAQAYLNLGSLAIQNENQVYISGGSIDGTDIGISTPATANFTSLSLTQNGFSTQLLSGASGGNFSITLPADTGSSGQVLTTGGAGGVLSWSTPTGTLPSGGASPGPTIYWDGTEWAVNNSFTVGADGSATASGLFTANSGVAVAGSETIIGSANAVELTVQSYPGQFSDLQDWIDNNNNLLASVSNTGAITSANTIQGSTISDGLGASLNGGYVYGNGASLTNVSASSVTNGVYTNIANTFSTGNQLIQTGGDQNVGLVIQAASDSGQFSDLQDWEDSNGTPQAWVDSNGSLASLHTIQGVTISDGLGASLSGGFVYGDGSNLTNVQVLSVLNGVYTNVANTITTGNQSILTGATTNVGLQVQGVQNQFSNLQNWLDYQGNTLASVGSDGSIASFGSIQGATVSDGAGAFLYNGQVNGDGSLLTNVNAMSVSNGVYTNWPNIITVGNQLIQTDNDFSVALKIQAAADSGQIADLQDWLGSSGSVLASVGNNGLITSFGGVSTPSIVTNSLVLNQSGGGFTTTVIAGAGSASVSFTLPSVPGLSGNVLTTDGTGNLSWGAGLPPSGPAGPLLYWNGTTWVPTSNIMIDDLGDLSSTGTLNMGSAILTNKVAVGIAGTASGKVNFMSQGGGQVNLKAPNGLASNITLVLPNSTGSAGQVLKTDGTGNLSWTGQAGTVALVGGIGTVSAASVTANSIVVVSYNTPEGGTPGILSAPKMLLNPGVGFQVRSTDTTDSISTVNWWLMN